ncbi:CLC2E protein, partial [Pterocles burchelli]|nr:CLC2E protein [Pterocles burchelli]
MPLPRRSSPGLSLKCIKDKKIPIGVTVVVAALLLTIIALAGKGPKTEIPPTQNPPLEKKLTGMFSPLFFFPAKKCPSCPSCPPPILPGCRENGIGYGEKCFYFVEDEADWNRSQSSCVALGAHLTAVDTPQELRFLLRYGSSSPYWIGLRREDSGSWKWFNGSFFNH